MNGQVGTHKRYAGYVELLRMREIGGRLHPALQAPMHRTYLVLNVEMGMREDDCKAQCHPQLCWLIEQQSPHHQNCYQNWNLHQLASDSGHALTVALCQK